MAGGLNLYGFANGDPINFSDPFGLCPEYLTGRPCLNPLIDMSGPPTLRADGNGGYLAARDGGPHRALDLAAPLGSRAGATDGGVIVNIGEGKKSGKFVVIGHPGADGGDPVSYSVYTHLGSLSPGLSKGAAVEAGQQIGVSGDTGNAKGTPPHLHFEVRTGSFGGRIDPSKELGIEGGGQQ